MTRWPRRTTGYRETQESVTLTHAETSFHLVCSWTTKTVVRTRVRAPDTMGPDGWDDLASVGASIMELRQWRERQWRERQWKEPVVAKQEARRSSWKEHTQNNTSIEQSIIVWSRFEWAPSKSQKQFCGCGCPIVVVVVVIWEISSLYWAKGRLAINRRPLSFSLSVSQFFSVVWPNLVRRPSWPHMSWGTLCCVACDDTAVVHFIAPLFFKESRHLHRPLVTSHHTHHIISYHNSLFGTIWPAQTRVQTRETANSS